MKLTFKIEGFKQTKDSKWLEIKFKNTNDLVTGYTGNAIINYLTQSDICKWCFYSIYTIRLLPYNAI